MRYSFLNRALVLISVDDHAHIDQGDAVVVRQLGEDCPAPVIVSTSEDDVTVAYGSSLWGFLTAIGCRWAGRATRVGR